MERKLTGRHVALIFVGAFSVIISVNLALAYNAVKTFPGLEVKNSYVASQEFDKKRAAQQALGWSVGADTHDGQVLLSITDANGTPVKVTGMTATLGRATHVQDDVQPEFVFNGAQYVTPLKLAAGNWNIRLVATSSDGTEFRQRVVLHVPAGGS